MVVCLVVWALATTASRVAVEATDALVALVSMEIPINDLTDAKLGNTAPSTVDLSEAVVILLGGLGCSGDQLAVLKWW